MVADWGMTAREIAAQAAAAKAAEATAQAKTAPAADKDKQTATAGTPRPSTARSLPIPPGSASAIPGISIQMPGSRLPSDAGSIGLVQPNRLGGPKPQADASRTRPR